MAHLIDKDALVAEIERRRGYYKRNPLLINAEYCIDEDNAILKFLDTLEVKEVDLEKELDYKDYIKFFREHSGFPDDWEYDETWIFAKYFFELGIKAQKGNNYGEDKTIP